GNPLPHSAFQSSGAAVGGESSSGAVLSSFHEARRPTWTLSATNPPPTGHFPPVQTFSSPPLYRLPSTAPPAISRGLEAQPSHQFSKQRHSVPAVGGRLAAGVSTASSACAIQQSAIVPVRVQGWEKESVRRSLCNPASPRGEKVDPVHQFSQPTTDDFNIEDKEIKSCGIPLSLSHLCDNAGSGAVTFVLEKASLALACVGKRYQILSSDEHADYLRKKNLNPYDYRPDIVHEALLQIMDSRLRLAGRLKAVYIHTNEGVLIKVEPYCMIPRTVGSFCNMIAELLQTLSIKAKSNRKKLLRVVANPVTKYLSPKSRKIGLSFSSQKAVQLREYVSGINCDEDVVFVVGVMAHGKIESDYIEDLVSVSRYHLSSAVCLRHICIALERKWSIC
ncbi:Ribosomal RNA small subunit methyltransferase NEP1, partial [Bienertia sinuspersici]